MLEVRERTNIALARPYFPENIGASARAMAVMGFSNLSVIKPYCDPYDEKAAILASHASETVLKNMSVHAHMQEWSSHCDLRVGFCLRDRAIGPPSLLLPQLPQLLRQQKFHKLGLLFGCEKSGLDNEELSFCHYVVEIPTSSVWNYHSLNLAQAVQIVVYTLHLDWDMISIAEQQNFFIQDPPALKTLQALEQYLDQVVHSPQMNSFSQRTTREQTLRRLRMIVSRAIVSQSDAEFFIGFLKKISES